MADLPKTVEQHSDEIDLTEVIRVLWDKKIWIILTTFVTTLLAGIYAFTAKEQWTSKATVIGPKVAYVDSYLSLRTEYANILEINDFSSEKILEKLFDNFKTALFSEDIKREFFTQSKWFAGYSLANGLDTEVKKQKFISDIIGNLVVQVPDLKKNPNAIGINISFVAETPVDAQIVLTEYVNFVNKAAFIEDQTNFSANIKIAIDNLELQKDRIQKDTESIREVQLENLNNALDIAKSAGIKEYARTVGNISIPQVALGDAQIPFSDSKLSDGAYLFMLGEKYLQAKVDTLTHNKVVYPVLLHKIEKQVLLLKGLGQKVENLNGMDSYYYLASPDYPMHKDKPKRIVILIIAALFGFFIGCFILGLISFYKIKKNKYSI